MIDWVGYMLWGLAFGFALSAPFGPVNIVVLQRTLFGRARHGVVIGLGAALGDAFYAGLAAFGLNFVHDIIDTHVLVLKILGAAIMGGLAVYIWRAHPHMETVDRMRPLKGGVFRSTVACFMITLTNPGVFFGLLAFYTAAGIGDLGADSGHPFMDASGLVLGVFLGAAVWWVCLSGIGLSLRGRINDGLLLRLNRGAAVLIGLFAGAAALSVFFHIPV